MMQRRTEAAVLRCIMMRCCPPMYSIADADPIRAVHDDACSRKRAPSSWPASPMTSLHPQGFNVCGETLDMTVLYYTCGVQR